MEQGQDKNQEYNINEWIEKDITSAALHDQLPKAFCIEDYVSTIHSVLNSEKFPILIGNSGVGKTAIIYEYIRQNIETFRRKKILQLSLKQKASTIKDPYKQMGAELKKLIDYLIEHKKEILVFFRDIHLVYQFDLESQLLFLGLQFDSPLFAEGMQSVVKSMLEETSELEQYFITIKINEPGIPKTLKILHEWAKEKKKASGMNFTTEVLEEAVFLSHRFLTRDKLPRKAILLLNQISSLKTDEKIISIHDVIDRFCVNHQIPRFLIDPSVKLDLAETERFFHSRVLGQEEAVAAIIKMISILKAGLSDIRRPFGVFLFVGPTGVGKTYIAKILAHYLFNDPEKVIRINMSDFPKDYDAFILFGDPNEYSPNLKRGLLTRKILGQPFAILLLDEFEKSHPSIHDRFLQLVDEGCFINGAGETVSCRSMIIIATSNVGAEIYRKNILGFMKKIDFSQIDKEIDQALYREFRFEFLNRFDHIVHFHPLKREHIRIIALRELESIRNRIGIKQRGFVIDFDESIIDWLAINGFDPDYGARFLRRIMEKNVSTALADYIVRFTPGKGAHILLTVRNNKILAKNAMHKPRIKQKIELTIPKLYKTETMQINRGNIDKIITSILERAESKLNLLEKQKTEASELLHVMNEDDFWENKEKKREVLEKYKLLDVTISIEKRLAKPIIELADTYASEKESDLSVYNKLIEKAATALYKWEQRLAEDKGGSVWMMLASTDPLSPDSRWLLELVNFEKKWCRRLNLYTTVAAYSTHDNLLTRVILEINGPGAYTYLLMEQGLHRKLNQNAKNERVHIEVFKRTILPDLDKIEVKQLKKKKGLFQLDITCKCKVKHEKLGIQYEIFSADTDVLKSIVFDIINKEESQTGTPAAGNVARIYGESGLVKDPRTGAAMQYNKHFRKGNLHDFLDTWMSTVSVYE